MAAAVYALCAALSVVCAGLLVRAYARTRSRLLLWTSACFVGLGLNNVLLVVDKLVVTGTDLTILRNAVLLASGVVLLWGLIWETR